MATLIPNIRRHLWLAITIMVVVGASFWVADLQATRLESERTLLMSGAAVMSFLVLLLTMLYLQRENIRQRLINTQKLFDEQQAHLNKSEHSYSTMFESAPEGVWMVGTDRQTTHVNQKMCDLLGYTRDDLLGLNPAELADEENSKIFDAKACITPSRETRVCEITLRHRDGHNIATEFRATHLFHGDGSVMGVMAFVTDLTERKKHQTEQLLLARRAAALLSLPAAAQTQDESAFLQFGLEMVEQLTCSQNAFVRFVAADQQHMEMPICSRADLEHNLLHRNDIWVEALRKRATLRVPEVANPTAEGAPPTAGARPGRLICVPVIDSDLVRMLMVVSDKPQPYSDFDLETIRLIAEAVWRTISQRRSDAALRKSQEALKEAQYIANLGSYVLDISTGSWESSDALDSLFGIDKSYERSVHGWEDLIHREDRAMMEAYFREEVVDQCRSFNKEYRITRYDDATVRWVHGLGKLEFDAQGGACQMHGTIQDITEVKLAEEALRRSEDRYRTLFATSPDGVIVNRLADGLYLDFNDGFLNLIGRTRDEIIGKTLLDINIWNHRDDRQRLMHALQADDSLENLEINFVAKGGKTVTALMSAHVTTIDGTPCILSVIRDITERKKAEDKLEHVAHFDMLTNLPNRVLLADRLQQAMLQCQRRGQRVAVVYLDLDGFKSINDRHGHEVGDQLLIGVATSMKQALREGDTLARLGGDEFVAVLLDLADSEACVPMLKRLLSAAAQPVQAGELLLQVSASVGVTFYPQTQDMDADQVLRQADQAMYQAKLTGKNRFHVFDADQDRSLRGHHESLARIGQALIAHEFVLHYQPKVRMRTGQIIGAEALIRWQHPELGLLAPAVFLPDIEDHPMAITIGEWVIDTALTQVELWHAAGIDMVVSVNVGARQLQQLDFVDRLSAILARHPSVNPVQLEIEILETSALEDVAQVSRVIEASARLGVTFALDDFGTGYSSLSYLKRLQVSLLKIDKSFVCDMLDDPDDLAILEGVISMGTAFKRQVIAEGVETVAHGTLLLQLGCELAQGYGIARPMPAEDLPSWAAVWRPDPAWFDNNDSADRPAKVQMKALRGLVQQFELETSQP